jgi:hypothetical protein
MPEFASVPVWREISGMSRSRTYEELAARNIRAVKCGRALLIDVRHGLEYVRSLPVAQIRPRATPRRRRVAEAEPSPQQGSPARQKRRRRAEAPSIESQQPTAT